MAAAAAAGGAAGAGLPFDIVKGFGNDTVDTSSGGSSSSRRLRQDSSTRPVVGFVMSVSSGPLPAQHALAADNGK